MSMILARKVMFNYLIIEVVGELTLTIWKWECREREDDR
jgi:hypothetical protein